MKKRTGSNYTLYLPDQLIAKARLQADERERSLSFIVSCALKHYLNPEKSINAIQGEGK